MHFYGFIHLMKILQILVIFNVKFNVKIRDSGTFVIPTDILDDHS